MDFREERPKANWAARIILFLLVVIAFIGAVRFGYIKLPIDRNQDQINNKLEKLAKLETRLTTVEEKYNELSDKLNAIPTQHNSSDKGLELLRAADPKLDISQNPGHMVKISGNEVKISYIVTNKTKFIIHYKLSDFWATAKRWNGSYRPPANWTLKYKINKNHFEKEHIISPSSTQEHTLIFEAIDKLFFLDNKEPFHYCIKIKSRADPVISEILLDHFNRGATDTISKAMFERVQSLHVKVSK